MKNINTTNTQTVADAIAFGECLLELNPKYEPSFLNFLRTQDPQALLTSEEVESNWEKAIDLELSLKYPD